MERLRSPSTAPADASEAKVAPVALSALLEGVKSPGVERKDVDALLAGLDRPLAEGESPRARADLLLSLLNSPHLGSMRGREGRTVRAAAVQAMLELGHPYALEIPPEAVGARHRDSRASRGLGRRSIPVVGILVALLTVLPATVYPVALLLALPALMALLGGALEIRGLQKAGVALMVLLGVGLLVTGAWLFYRDVKSTSDLYDGLGRYFGMVGMGLGTCHVLGSFLLRHPAWRIEGEAFEEDETA